MQIKEKTQYEIIKDLHYIDILRIIVSSTAEEKNKYLENAFNRLNFSLKIAAINEFQYNYLINELYKADNLYKKN